jgi:hypothetical protein
MRAGGRTGVKKLIVAVRSFSNALKKRKTSQSASAVVLNTCVIVLKKVKYQDPKLTDGMKRGVFVDERGHRVLY